MPRSNFDDVGEFHHQHDIFSVTWHGAAPRRLEAEEIEKRADEIEDALHEMRSAVQGRNHPELAEALLHIVYSAMGAAHLAGYPWQDLWNEHQRAMLDKVKVRDGRVEKIVPPANWEPPQLEKLLDAHGFGLL